MAPSIQYASFLIRLWRQAGMRDDEPGVWRGEVEHIQSGKSWIFNSLVELKEFLGTEAVDPQRMDLVEIKEEKDH